MIAAQLPAERPGRRGRPRIWPLRRIIEAILYLDRTGCAWRYLPADFPPRQTVYTYFAAWRDDGTLARLHAELRAQDIPGVWMSSGCFRLREVFPVAPRGGLVVAGAGLEASVQDADEPAGQSSQGVVMFESFGALGVVERAGAG